MAKYWTNRGRYALAKGTFDSATKNVLACTGTAPSATAIADYNVVNDLLTASGVAEVAVSGYGRAAYAVTIAEDDTGDRVTLTYTATPSFGSAVAVGATITMVACFNTSGTDATRELYWVDILSTPLPTNGSGMSYTSATDTMA